MKAIVSILLLLTLLLNPALALAESYPSNTLTIQIGQPTQPALPVGGSNGSILKAARDLFDAYNNYGGNFKGFTYTSSSVADLKSFLATRGYSQEVLNAFEKRRTTAQPRGCAECLGFVVLVDTLATGRTDTFNYFNPAAIFGGRIYVPGSQPITFTSGGRTFISIVSDQIEPGDIAITLADANSSDGHIAIVGEADNQTSPYTFVGIESSYPVECKVNNAQKHSRKDYNFFRISGG